VSATKHDELETRLVDLFDRQAATIASYARECPDARAPRRHTRRVLAVCASAAAVAAVILLAVTFGQSSAHVRVRPSVASQTTTPQQPASPSVRFETKQVLLQASALVITAGGNQFTPQTPVNVHTDPGDAHYQTLELGWQQHGVQMAMNIYFASDRHDWYATEIRTYDGHAYGKWIEYLGEQFRTPLGQAFTGDVSLRPSDGTSGAHLSLTGLQLEAFRQPAACKGATTPYIVDPAYDPVDFSGGINATLVDTRTCAPVADVSPFAFSYGSDDPSIAAITYAPIDDPSCSTCATRGDVVLRRPGDTIGTVRVVTKATAKVVASATFRVHATARAIAEANMQG
jgi:hypothetical protein